LGSITEAGNSPTGGALRGEFYHGNKKPGLTPGFFAVLHQRELPEITR